MPSTPGQPFTNMQPYLAVTQVTPLGGFGIYPSQGAGSAVGNTLGFIYSFAGTFSPGGSYLADGRLINIAEDDTTFTLIGTIFGGDGQNNYGLPDLRGQVIMGEGSGGGLTPRDLGSAVGTASVGLDLPQIPQNTTPPGGGGQAFSTVQPSLPLRRLICVEGTFPGQSGTTADAAFIGQVATFQGTITPGGWLDCAGQTLPIAGNQALFSILGTTYGGNGTTNFQLPDLRGRVSVGADNTQPLGTTFGQEAVTLTVDNLPPSTGTDQPVNNDQPSLALNYLICTSGAFPGRNPGDFAFDTNGATLGQIVEFAGNFAPAGWAFAHGQTLPIAGNTALFSLIGTIYGGNGTTNFQLPDLRGRTLIGAGTAGGVNYSVGDTGGTDTIVLVADNLPAPCFAAGTRIMTARGEIAVEALVEGDLVPAQDRAGTRSIRWIGQRRMAIARHPRPWDVQPVRVRAGAFGPALPHTDLWLSPDHAVLVLGRANTSPVLIPVRYLINGATIVQEAVDTVTYYHVELADCAGAAVHGVLLAHGLAVESFLDTGNRAAFDNSGAPLMLHADFALKTRATPPWAELVLDGPRLAFARTALLARAEAMGHALTDDPGLHLLVDGVIVRPRRSGEVYGFTLPAGAGDVRLVSHHTVPAQVQPDSSDARRLGVAVTRLLLNRGELPLTDCRISDGWHAAEEGWRWTTGDAALPAACGGTLKVHVAAMQRYWAAAPRDAAAA